MKKRIVVITGICVCVILLCIYFYLFFQKGILFEGKFVKQNDSTSAMQYSGTVYSVPVNILVDGDIRTSGRASVTYEFADFKKQYNVELSNKNNIKVFDENTQLFEGKYTPNSNGFDLYEKNDVPYLDPDTLKSYTGDESQLKNYKNASVTNIIHTVFGDNVVNRGNHVLLFMALLLIVILFVDIKFPLFFFELRHMFSVNNPEPSDFYLDVQRLIWYVTPFIIAGVLVASLIKPV